MIESSVPEGAMRNQRVLKGIEAWRDGCVGWSGGWVVAGGDGDLFRVSLNAERCECAEHLLWGVVCAHVYAALIARAKTRRCSGCSEPFPKREMVEVAGRHGSSALDAGVFLCEGCAEAAGAGR